MFRWLTTSKRFAPLFSTHTPPRLGQGRRIRFSESGLSDGLTWIRAFFVRPRRHSLHALLRVARALRQDQGKTDQPRIVQQARSKTRNARQTGFAQWIAVLYAVFGFAGPVVGQEFPTNPSQWCPDQQVRDYQSNSAPKALVGSESGCTAMWNGLGPVENVIRTALAECRRHFGECKLVRSSPELATELAAALLLKCPGRAVQHFIAGSEPKALVGTKSVGTKWGCVAWSDPHRSIAEVKAFAFSECERSYGDTCKLIAPAPKSSDLSVAMAACFLTEEGSNRAAACTEVIESGDTASIIAAAYGARGFAHYNLRDYRLAVADWDFAIRFKPGLSSRYETNPRYRLARVAIAAEDAVARQKEEQLQRFADAESALRRNDAGTAVRLLEPLASAGDLPAVGLLATIYFSGKGVPPDDRRVAELSLLGARKREAAAQARLGLLYLRGQGVPADDVLAYVWSNFAAAGFLNVPARTAALRTRDRAGLDMTPEQFARARILGSMGAERIP
jgi:hypothetical protein